ncbi:MAG: hypothetical protein WA948_02715 [Pontixanthobacter sp.]
MPGRMHKRMLGGLLAFALLIGGSVVAGYWVGSNIAFMENARDLPQ